MGLEAYAFTKMMLENAKRITLGYDMEKRDKYGRVLAYVYADGKNVQEKLLKKGLARVDYVYESRRHLETFKEVEQFAKEKKIGVWQCPGYVTNKGFNKEKWCKENSQRKTVTGHVIVRNGRTVYFRSLRPPRF